MSFRMKPAVKSLQTEKKVEKAPVSFSLFEDESAISFLDTVSGNTPRTSTVEKTQTPRSGSNVGIAIRNASQTSSNDGPRRGNAVGMSIRRTPTEDN
jgi:hypothetical protein